MTCSVSGIQYITNPFTVYVGWYPYCNDDSGDITPISNPPNNYYILDAG